MNPSSPAFAIRNAASDLSRRQRIAQAVAVAECGHPCKALAIAEVVPADARHAEDWDLIARLLTQMSRFQDARSAWEQAALAGMSPARVGTALKALDARRHITLIALVLIAAAGAIASILALIILAAVFS